MECIFVLGRKAKYLWTFSSECGWRKAILLCTTPLGITFSKPHPEPLLHSQVSWNSHKMKSSRVCLDYRIVTPNWNTEANQVIGNKPVPFPANQNMTPMCGSPLSTYCHRWGMNWSKVPTCTCLLNMVMLQTHVLIWHFVEQEYEHFSLRESCLPSFQSSICHCMFHNCLYILHFNSVCFFSK